MVSVGSREIGSEHQRDGLGSPSRSEPRGCSIFCSSADLRRHGRAELHGGSRRAGRPHPPAGSRPVSSHDALVVVQKGDQSLGPHMSAMMKIEQQPRTYLAVRGLRDGRGYRRPDGAVTDAEALGDRRWLRPRVSRWRRISRVCRIDSRSVGRSSPWGWMAPGPSRAATLRPPSPWRMPDRRGDHEDRSRWSRCRCR
jgi:hypothetical protein